MGGQDPSTGPGPEDRLGRDSGATNAGEVSFEDLGGGQTSVRLVLEYEPEGLIEKIGDKLNIVENQAKADLNRFKTFIESEGYASGAWRSSVNPEGSVQTPGIEHAERSRGDSGKAGVSGKAVAAAVGVAAAAGVGAAIRNKKDPAPDQQASSAGRDDLDTTPDPRGGH